MNLHATLPDVARETALEIVKAAHAICPYSNATRGNIAVEVSLAEG